MALFPPGNNKSVCKWFCKMMDVVGQNYRGTEIAAAPRSQPNMEGRKGAENGLTQFNK